MDAPPWGGFGPFSYLVGEHARAIVAIQELQREVTSLLTFREHVLESLPHLKPPQASPRTRPTSNKSLSEGTSTAGPSTVVDSGFSTDKASTSMGKSSSSSSAGDLSWGPPRWTCVEPEASGGPPLGSAEDELWQLLDVIQKKGTRLRMELEKAEVQEREYGHASDSVLQNRNLSEPVSGPSKVASAAPGPLDFWPHSLPGGMVPNAAHTAGSHHRLDFMHPGLDAWNETEKLRQDRYYLIGRVSRAEAEAAVSHTRLLDLHSQLISLATEKRRLEDAFRALRIMQEARMPQGDMTLLDPYSSPPSNWHLPRGSEAGHVLPVPSGASATGSSRVIIGDSSPKTPKTYRGQAVPSPVTVSIKGELKGGRSVSGDPGHYGSRRYSNPRSDDGVVLPRVLKVSIRDKSENKQQGQSPSTSSKSSSISPKVNPPDFTNPSAAKLDESPIKNPTAPSVTPLGSDRVVIERQRTTNKVDGGLSMPASLLKGAKMKVSPNKQRISAILRDRDVLSLQKQLLTTVMETEVLKKQLDCAGDEWAAKLKEWESERHKNQESISNLTLENKNLKEQLEEHKKPSTTFKDVGVWASPTTRSMCIGTETDSDEMDPTYSVHQGPNVKYDVVVYQESTPPKSSEHQLPNAPSPAPRKTSIEKPPRRSREGRGPLSSTPSLSPTPYPSSREPKTFSGGSTPPPSQSHLSLASKKGDSPSTPLSLAPKREIVGGESSFGRDSLGRVAKVPLKSTNSISTRFSAPSATQKNSSTPTGTPRSSPSSSISFLRSGRAVNGATPTTTMDVPRSTTHLRNGLSPHTSHSPRLQHQSAQQHHSRVIQRKESNPRVLTSGSASPSGPFSSAHKGGTHAGASAKVRSRGTSFINRWLNIRE